MTRSPWKFDHAPERPVDILPGRFYRTRGAGTAFVAALVVIPPRGEHTHPTWYGWNGYLVERGRRCMWDLTGNLSPVAYHGEDIVPDDFDVVDELRTNP